MSWNTRNCYIEDVFIKANVYQDVQTQNLGEYMDEKINFSHQIEEKTVKAIKRIGIIKKLHKTISRNALTTLYISFLKLYLDYVQFVFDQSNNEFISYKLNSMRCNTAIAIIDTIKGAS